MNNLIKREWHILGDTMGNIPEFLNPPRMAPVHAEFKCDLDTQSRTQKIGKIGCYPCYRCSNCSNMIRGDKFVHPHTGEVIKINHYLTCNSDFVIYILTCPCQMLYVGETTNTFRKRINNHKSTIRTGKVEFPVPKHFRDKGHHLKDLKYMIVDHVPKNKRGGDRVTLLKKKEL